MFLFPRATEVVRSRNNGGRRKWFRNRSFISSLRVVAFLFTSYTFQVSSVEAGDHHRRDGHLTSAFQSWTYPENEKSGGKAIFTHEVSWKHGVHVMLSSSLLWRTLQLAEEQSYETLCSYEESKCVEHDCAKDIREFLLFEAPNIYAIGLYSGPWIHYTFVGILVLARAPRNFYFTGRERTLALSRSVRKVWYNQLSIRTTVNGALLE